METSEITLHEWQSKAWHCTKRFVFFCAGVQSGKTTFGSVWIINESEIHGPGDYLIIAPTYKILQQSTMQKFQELVPRGWGVFNKAESTFRTIDGRMFFLRSGEHPESIEGITAKAIWADEASLMKANAWLMMQGRVSRTQGRILCTFTPIALNWIHKELEKDRERKLRGEPGDIEFIQFRSVDSPYFPKKEFERAKRMLTPTQFQLRYEGVFGKAEGLIYPDFCEYNIVDDFAIPRDWTKAGGIDWGYNNPFVALEGAVSPDDVLFIYKERYKNRCLLKDHMEYLNPDITYFADPSGKQEIEEMVALGFDVQSANNDVNLGIQKVNERIRPTTDDMRSIRSKVFKSCVNTINEKALYRYDKDKEKPVKEDDHCFIAGTLIKTLCGEIPIENVTSDDYALTRKGYKRVLKSRMTNSKAKVIKVTLSDGRQLIGTSNHPIWVKSRGFVPLDAMRYGDIIKTCQTNASFTKEFHIEDIQIQNLGQTEFIIEPVGISNSALGIYIGKFGKMLMVRFQRVMLSIMKMAIPSIIQLIISKLRYLFSIGMNMVKTVFTISLTYPIYDHLQLNGIVLQREGNGIADMPKRHLKKECRWKKYVFNVGQILKRWDEERQIDSVLTIANLLAAEPVKKIMKNEFVQPVVKNSSVINIQNNDSVPAFVLTVSSILPNFYPVYNLTIDDVPEFFANGILVHNCMDAERYLHMGLDEWGSTGDIEWV